MHSENKQENMKFSRNAHESAPFTVYCVCGGFGFPFGTASTNRVRLIGRCLVSTGIAFHVLHIGPSPIEENKHEYGEFEDITFEYLSPSVRWPSNIITRICYYLWGCIHLIFRLLHYRHNGLAYVYYQGDFINLWTLWLCRLMKMSTVQEVCEWWPGTANGTLLNEWIYRNIMFHWSSGAMPISHEIRDRILNIAGPDYPLCMMPVLVNPAEHAMQSNKGLDDAPPPPLLLWCGMVDGYKRDVLFVIDAMANLKSKAGQNSILYTVGPCSEETRAELLSYATSKNISTGRVSILGFVSDVQLRNYCAQADALLMPLWDDDRSRTRFPTKIGQYLVAGRPIVTAQIGEVKYFLTDQTAIFYIPGDATSLATSLDRLLTDPVLGEQVAGRATLEVLPKLDFESNAERISKWFCEIYSGGQNL
jgi:glycosyltransferase involved in cell wall biosynthesis